MSTMREISGRKRAEEGLQALQRVSIRVPSPMEFKERLDRLLQTARTALELNRVNILLADPAGRWLQAVASTERGKPLEAIRVPIGPGGGGVAKAYLTRETVVWNGRTPVPDEIRLKPPYDKIEALRSRVFAHVPLVVQGQGIGVLGADRKHSRRPLEPATLKLLQLFAAQAALAIEHASLSHQIEERKREWDVTFDSISDGIALLDEQGKVARANRAFGSVWETPPQGLIGASWHDVSDRLDLSSPCPHCEARRTRQPASAEARLPASNRILALTAFPPQPREAVYPESTAGTLLVIRDITAERQTERLVLMGHLAAGVAHEINNPLSVILGFSQLLLKRADLHGEVYRDLKLIEKHARACRQIVDDLRHIAHPLPPQRELVDIGRLIQETLEPLEHGMASVKVRVSLIPDPHLRLLWADPRRLSRVLLNLITNAADAMPEGGSLTITCQVRQKEWVEIAISDTGVGIPPERVRWIFDPFVTTKPAGKGMGLGLSLTARIVSDHGGRIEVESKVGRGSTFRVLLPLRVRESRSQTLEGFTGGSRSFARRRA